MNQTHMRRPGGRSGQRGITLIGFLIVLAIVGFFAYIAMKLVPIYNEYFSIVSAMKAVQSEPGIANKTPTEIRGMLSRRFDIGYVKSVEPQDAKITRADGYILQIKYEVREPFVYNIDLVVSFDKSVNLLRTDSAD